MNVDAVVLAGGRAEPALAAATGTDHRALLSFRGKPFLEWVLEALRGCAFVDRIAIVGPGELREMPFVKPPEIVVPEREGIFENFRAGVRSLDGARKVLVTAVGIPSATALRPG